MQRIKSIMKSKAMTALSLMPFGRDLYLTAARQRLHIGYRGMFDSYGAAKRATSPGRPAQYDIVNRSKADNEADEKAQLDSWFHDIDYALLFWLDRVMAKHTTLLELGGSVGHFYYSFKKYLDYPPGLKWTVAELPEAVKLGTKIARERGAEALRFVDSSAMSTADAAAIFMTSGTLQYMQIDLWDILSGLRGAPQHVLLHNMPVHAEREYWTLQDLGVCEVPYRIYSKPRLEMRMAGLNYELVASWTKPRTIEIPFHRDMEIEGYSGFYYRAA